MSLHQHSKAAFQAKAAAGFYAALENGDAHCAAAVSVTSNKPIKVACGLGSTNATFNIVTNVDKHTNTHVHAQEYIWTHANTQTSN